MRRIHSRSGMALINSILGVTIVMMACVLVYRVSFTAYQADIENRTRREAADMIELTAQKWKGGAAPVEGSGVFSNGTPYTLRAVVETPGVGGVQRLRLAVFWNLDGTAPSTPAAAQEWLSIAAFRFPK